MRRAWIVADVVTVALFVAIGRSSHHHAFSLSGFASTTWPFAVGLAGGWIALTVARRDPSTPVSGVILTVATVAIGMILRVWSGQGTAVAFVVVALVFLGALMIAPRYVAARLQRRRRSTT